MAYDIYERTIAAPRWAKLAAAGALPQRLLWASTGTKDPRYPDTYYIDALLGADTVNTVPPATLDAFLDHGKPAARIKDDLDGAKKTVAEFAAVGLDLSRVCHGLLDDGVKSFITSMKTLLDAVGGRRAALLESASGRQRLVAAGRTAEGDGCPRRQAGEGPRAGPHLGGGRDVLHQRRRRTSGRSRAASAGCARRR